MSTVRFQQLTKLPLVGSYQRAFRTVTGMRLHLVPADPRSPGSRATPGTKEFCRLLERNPRFRRDFCTGCAGASQPSNCDPAAPQTARCPAGFAIVTSPVVVEGRQIATWIGERAMFPKSAGSNFTVGNRRVAPAGALTGRRPNKAAGFGAGGIPADQLLALRQLLVLFARHVAQHLEAQRDRRRIASFPKNQLGLSGAAWD